VTVIRSCIYSIIFLLISNQTYADEFNPALLEISEFETGWFSLTWKVPLQNGQPLQISPLLPDNLQQMGPTSTRLVQNSLIEESTWALESGALVGGTIEISGLSSIPIDVIVHIVMIDGSQHSTILRPSFPTFEIPERATTWQVAASYWKIGTIHILEGFDHLLFVLALLFIVQNTWMLLKTITAFTVAHSVSLALATLGIVNIPGAPTEAVIALSILFLAVEIMHSKEGKVYLTQRYPWLIALVFGLVHGLGFAGALAEVGLPQQDIPIALLMFNLGVETGQILFVGAMLLTITLIKKLPIRWPQQSWKLMPYTIGSIAAFWTVTRVMSFV
jgi:hypothetical protein